MLCEYSRDDPGRGEKTDYFGGVLPVRVETQLVIFIKRF